MKFTLVLAAIDNVTRVVDTAVNNTVKRLDSIKKRTDAISKSWFAFGRDTGAMALAVALPLMAATREAENAEVATNRLKQVFKSMGETTDKAATQAQAFASSLQMKIGIEDETIMAAQAKLTTFHNVVTQQARDAGIYNRATQAAFDLQAAGFGQGEQNAVQLGKALQDPVKGINALSRSGITFTKQERTKIETLTRTGKILEAQQLVLGAIEKQVGGVAEATATESSKMRAAWSEVMEQLGGALLPTFQALADTMINKVVPAIQSFLSTHQGLVTNIAKGLAIFAAISATLSVVSFVFGGVMKVISVGTRVFQLLGFAIRGLIVVIRAVSAAMMANPILLIIAAIAVAAYLIITNWDKVKAFFIKLWDYIKIIFNKAIDFLKKLFFNFTPLGLIIKHWAKITAFFRNLWDGVRDIFMKAVHILKKIFWDFNPYVIIVKNFSKIWDWLKGFGKKMYDAGRNLIQQIWDGIKSLVMKPVEAVKNMVGKIRDFLPFSPAKTGPLRDIHRVKIIETIAQTIKPGPLVKAMRTAVVAGAAVIPMVSNIATAQPITNAASRNAINNVQGGGVSVTYNPTITLGGAATEKDREDFVNLLDQHKNEVVRLVNDAQNRKNRLQF